VLWPFGYTYNDTAPGMTATDNQAFRTLGQNMAGTNNYTPEQASDLYITDGSIDDYLWGAHKIFGYTFEMYPSSSAGGGFYPPDEVIPAQTSRNREAVLRLLEYADCVYRIIGQTCGTPPPPDGPYFENLTNVNIPDNTTVYSNISVTGVTGNAPADLRVDVDIKHTYRGDLVLSLVAPDGSVYLLEDFPNTDSGDNVLKSYTVNASAEVANGTWRLRVQDIASFDTGYIDKFALQF